MTPTQAVSALSTVSALLFAGYALWLVGGALKEWRDERKSLRATRHLRLAPPLDPVQGEPLRSALKGARR